MELLSLYVLALLILLTSLFFFYLFNHHHGVGGAASLPPGKTGLPFIGESLSFLFAGYKGQPENFIFERVKKYSSYTFKTHLFGAQGAVFAGSNGNKFLFSNENKLVRTWWPKSIDKVFPSSTQTSSTEEMIKMRKMLPNFFKAEALRNYIGTMDEIARKHFESEWENRDRVLVFPLTKEYTFLIACKLFMSVEDSLHVEKFSKPFNSLTAGLISIPIDFPGTPFNKAVKASKYIRKELVSIIEQRKVDLREGKASPTQDILSHMLLFSDEDGKFMHEMDIADKILGLLVGGHDTASSACAFIVKFLAELPEIYEGVYREQMEIAESKSPGEYLNWEDIQKMKYSWNVACEVLRLAPPVQGAFREALSDFTFDGFSIPKGWKLYWSANSTHKNPEFFPDPYRFDPSRFDRSGPAPYSFVPFGGGPRMCPGKEYARLEILVFMHHLVKRFRWTKIIADEKIVVNPTPVPANDLPVRLYPRHDN